MTYGPLNRRVTGPFNLALHTTLANKYKYSGRVRFFLGKCVSCNLQLFYVGFNSMPNLIVIFSIIYSLYVCGFLIVRDKCERV